MTGCSGEFVLLALVLLMAGLWKQASYGKSLLLPVAGGLLLVCLVMKLSGIVEVDGLEVINISMELGPFSTPSCSFLLKPFYDALEFTLGQHQGL